LDEAASPREGTSLCGSFAANRFVQAAFLISLAVRKALSVWRRRPGGDEGSLISAVTKDEKRMILPPDDKITDNSRKGESKVPLLARLAECARLFRSADGRSSGQVPVGDRQEIYRLNSAGSAIG
jgi:hypothetical protein